MEYDNANDFLATSSEDAGPLPTSRRTHNSQQVSRGLLPILPELALLRLPSSGKCFVDVIPTNASELYLPIQQAEPHPTGNTGCGAFETDSMVLPRYFVDKQDHRCRSGNLRQQWASYPTMQCPPLSVPEDCGAQERTTHQFLRGMHLSYFGMARKICRNGHCSTQWRTTLCPRH